MTDSDSTSKQPTEWFVRRANKEHGPFSSKQLRAMATNGKLTANDILRKGDSPKWIKADSVKGLFLLKKDVQTSPFPSVASDPPANTATSEKATGTFMDWYKALWVSRLPTALQVGVWLLYGWLWIPGLYFVQNKSVGVVFKVIGCIVLLSLLLPAIQSARNAAKRAESRHGEVSPLSDGSAPANATSGQMMTITGEWVLIEEGEVVRLRVEPELNESECPNSKHEIQRFVSERLPTLRLNPTCFVSAEEWNKVKNSDVVTFTGKAEETDEPIGPLVLRDCRIKAADAPAQNVSIQMLQYFRGYRSGVDIGLQKRRQFERETDAVIKRMIENEITELMLDYHRQAQSMTSAGGQKERLEGIGDGLRSGFHD